MFCSIGYSQFNADSTMYSDGALKSKTIYHSSYSERYYYYPTGQINVREEVRASMIDGVRKTFYIGGQLKSEEQYRMGVLEGKASYYYKTGRLKRQGVYEKDLYAGVWRSYFDDSDSLIKSIGGYVDGRPEAEWTFYGLEKGVCFLSHRGNYLSGLKNGLWYSYYPEGALKSRSVYELNELSGSFVRYSKKGKVVQKGAYKEGNPVDRWLIRSSLGFYRSKIF